MPSLQGLKSQIHQLTPYFFYLLIISTLGPFLFGYHLAELNAPQDVITCIRRSLDTTVSSLPQCIPMNALQLGLVSSAFTLGGLIGALVAGPLTAKYGRLQPMRLTTGFATIGPLAEAVAPNIAVMVLGRFISGLGAGAVLVVVPIYVSEIAPPQGKGLFGAFTQVMINTGIFTAQFLGYFLSYNSMWRVVLAAGGIIGLAQMAGLTFAVDSPKWQADHGLPRKAKNNLRRIRGHNTDIIEETRGWKIQSSEEDDAEYETLIGNEDHTEIHERGRDGTSQSKGDALGAFQVLFHRDHGHATVVVMIALAAQQFCGINSIIMYGVSLLSDLLKANSALLNIMVSILNIVLTAACAPLIDILGRKPCLLSSLATMGTASILLGIGIKSSIPIMSTIAVLLFVGGFALGLGPVPFLLSAELVGPEAVGATQSWGLAANWIATFLVAQFFPILNQQLGKGIMYFVFAALDVFFFALVFYFVPETKGKRDADEVWGRKSAQQD